MGVEYRIEFHPVLERVDYVGIRVRDLNRALAFYRVLGFFLAHRSKGDDVAIVCNGSGVKPAFREAFQRRRCLVPVDNFYEQAKSATGKRPYAIALADRSLMALAGLRENWRSPAGERVRSFAIVTTTPNELCARLDNRMPVVLKPKAWPVWLGEEPADASTLKALLAPFPSGEMTCWPVSARVGNVKNNDPGLIEPIAA